MNETEKRKEDAINKLNKKWRVKNDAAAVSTGNETKGNTLKDEFFRTLAEEMFSPEAIEKAWKVYNSQRITVKPVDITTGGWVKKGSTISNNKTDLTLSGEPYFDLKQEKLFDGGAMEYVKKLIKWEGHTPESAFKKLTEQILDSKGIKGERIYTYEDLISERKAWDDFRYTKIAADIDITARKELPSKIAKLTPEQIKKAIKMNMIPNPTNDFNQKNKDAEEIAILKMAIKYGKFTEKQVNDFLSNKKEIGDKTIKGDIKEIYRDNLFRYVDTLKEITNMKNDLADKRNDLADTKMKIWIANYVKERSDMDKYEALLDEKIEILDEKLDRKLI